MFLEETHVGLEVGHQHTFEKFSHVYIDEAVVEGDKVRDEFEDAKFVEVAFHFVIFFKDAFINKVYAEDSRLNQTFFVNIELQF